MRKNNRIHIDQYDRVYVEIPQCKWLRSIVAEPLKSIYYNRSADAGANIDKLFRNVFELERFIVQNMIDLF